MQPVIRWHNVEQPADGGLLEPVSTRRMNASRPAGGNVRGHTTDHSRFRTSILYSGTGRVCGPGWKAGDRHPGADDPDVRRGADSPGALRGPERRAVRDRESDAGPVAVDRATSRDVRLPALAHELAVAESHERAAIRGRIGARIVYLEADRRG